MIYKILTLALALGWVTMAAVGYVRACRTHRAVVELCRTLERQRADRFFRAGGAPDTPLPLFSLSPGEPSRG